MDKILKDNLSETTLYAVDMLDNRGNKKGGKVRKYVNLDEDLVNFQNSIKGMYFVNKESTLKGTIFYDITAQEYYVIQDNKKYSVSETEVGVLYKLTGIKYESAILVAFARKKELNLRKDLSLQEVIELVNPGLNYSAEEYLKLGEAISNVEELVSRLSDSEYYLQLGNGTRLGEIFSQLRNSVGIGLSGVYMNFNLKNVMTSNLLKLIELLGGEVDYDVYTDKLTYYEGKHQSRRAIRLRGNAFNTSLLNRIKDIAETKELMNKEEVLDLLEIMLEDSKDKESVLTKLREDYLSQIREDKYKEKYVESYKRDIETVLKVIEYKNFTGGNIVNDLKNAGNKKTGAIKDFRFRKNEEEVINLLKGTILNRKISVTYMKELLLSTKTQDFAKLFSYNDEGLSGVPKGVVVVRPRLEISNKINRGIVGVKEDYLREVTEYFQTEGKLFDITTEIKELPLNREVESVKLGRPFIKEVSGELDFKVGEYTETKIQVSLEDVTTTNLTRVLPVLSIEQKRRKLDGEGIVNTLIDKTKPDSERYNGNSIVKVVDRSFYGKDTLMGYVADWDTVGSFNVRGVRGLNNYNTVGFSTNLSSHINEVLGKTLTNVGGDNTLEKERYSATHTVLVDRLLKELNNNHELGVYLNEDSEKGKLLPYLLHDNLVGSILYKTSKGNDEYSVGIDGVRDKVKELVTSPNFVKSVREYGESYLGDSPKYDKVKELVEELKLNVSDLIENLITLVEKVYKYSQSQDFQDILTADIERESLAVRYKSALSTMELGNTVLDFSKGIEDIVNKYTSKLDIDLGEDEGEYNLVGNVEIIYEELNKLYDEVNNYILSAISGNVLNISSSKYTKSDNKQYKEYFIKGSEESLNTSFSRYTDYKVLNKYFSEGYNLKHKLKSRGILGRVLTLMRNNLAQIPDLFKTLNQIGIEKDSDKMVVLDYMITDCDIRQCISIRGVLGIYRDYISMYAKLVENGMREASDFNKTPYSLKLEHDIVMKEYEVIKTQIDEKKFIGVYDEHKVLGLTNLKLTKGTKDNPINYKIIEPDSGKDLKEEGKELNHCVGSYTRRVLSNQSLIYFIREEGKEDESYYTLEVLVSEGNYRLGQIRGMSNKALTVQKWKKAINSRLSLVNSGKDCSDKRRDKFREELINKAIE